MINPQAWDKHSKVGAGSGDKQDPREILELRVGPHPSASAHVFTGPRRQVYVLEMSSAEPKSDSKGKFLKLLVPPGKEQQL